MHALAGDIRYVATLSISTFLFVKDKFESEYQGSLTRLENSVEEEYIATMKQACYSERSYRKFH